MTSEVIDQMPNQLELEQSCFGIRMMENCLFFGERVISNFSIEQITPLCAPEDPYTLEAIYLRVCLSGSVFREVILDLRKGALVRQILNQVPACRLLVNSAGIYLDAFLLDMAERTRAQVGPAIYFRENGLHQLWNNKWVMVCGDEVLGDCGNTAVFVQSTVSSLRLAWDSELCVDEAIECQVRAMEANTKTVQVAFAFTLLSALRSELMKRGFSTFPLLYVQGVQNFGKTVLVTQQCLLYDRKDSAKVAAKLEPISSEKGIIAEISAYRDQVVLVDDMAKSSNISVERDRIKKMAGLIRYAANDSERRIATSVGGTKVQVCETGVAMTGEIPFTAASDLSRIVQVLLTVPLRGGREDARRVAATSFRAWIQWVLPQMDDWFEKLRCACEQAEPVGQARLQKTHILLSWVLTCFYQFAWERKVIASERYFTSAVREAKNTLSGLLGAQADLIEKSAQPVPKGNLSWYILQGFRKNEFRVVSRKKLKHDSDCVLEDGVLCMTLSTLKDFLRATPWNELSKNDIGDRLEQEKVIPPIGACKEKRRAKKRICSKRYLEIPLDKLKKAAINYE